MQNNERRQVQVMDVEERNFGAERAVMFARRRISKSVTAAYFGAPDRWHRKINIRMLREILPYLDDDSRKRAVWTMRNLRRQG